MSAPVTRLLDWLCYVLVMAWPLPLPDVRTHRLFGWILQRAGRHANGPAPAASGHGEPPF